MEKLINYLILAILLALGVLLYLKRDMIMDYFGGGQTSEMPMEEMVVEEETITDGE